MQTAPHPCPPVAPAPPQQPVRIGKRHDPDDDVVWPRRSDDAAAPEPAAPAATPENPRPTPPQRPR